MKNLWLLLFAVIFTSCLTEGDQKDVYYGRCDVDIIRLSAQTMGIIDSLTFAEGALIKKDQILLKINTERLAAQLKQQNAQLKELSENVIGLNSQMKQVAVQLQFAKDTYQKTLKMVSQGAATVQKKDELQTQVLILQAKMNGMRSQLRTLDSKREQLLAAQIITKLNLRDAEIKSPVHGVIINKFHYQGELVTPGMAILEVADLSEMEVTIYISLEDLGNIKIGQQVDALVDGREEKLAGVVKWIASQSEFTPKTILTKDVRTTLVYAVKIAVSNADGVLKIGMPVDIEI